ncbi:hypothetical protein M8J76_001286 [Diaphorina citri]|nr:hypothetical protein M8J76_001286 [Diaphorina citri]
MDPPKFDHLFVEDDLKVEGLGNKEALEILIEDVESLAKEYTTKKNTWSHIKDVLNLFNQRSFVNILSAVLLLLSVVALIASNLTIFLWLILVLFGVVSVGVNAWDNYCRHYEIYYRIQYVLSQLRDCVKYEWNESSYPHLYMPFSPCINLQWTHRAGHVVNVPWSLLVRGDCILLRPGQAAPAYCVRYQPKDGHINELKFGDIYNPTRSFNPRVSKPTARSPVQNAVFVLQNTPYVRILEGTLLQCVDKPVDYYTSSLYTLNVKCVLVILVNIFRHNYYTEWLNHISWLDLCLIQPITITLPLLPMVLPIAWFIMNNYGNAVLQSSYQQEFSSNNSCLDVKKIIHKKHILNLGTWSVLKSNFISCVKGDGKFLTRTANLLHVLGSVEEPTPRLNPKEHKDKIEEMDNSREQDTRPGNHGQGEGDGQRPEGCSEPGDPLHSSDRCGTLEKKRVQIVEEVKENDVKTKKSDKGFKQYRPIAEVLDLTHNKYSPFELNFDSPQWSEHLSSLKPLGLAILLNTCNKFTQAHYTQFCSHVTCQALYSDLLVPVSNRRCLCELAKQIGFAYNAAENYRLDLQLSTYRHFPAEKIRRDVKFARALQLPVQTKLKFPFPHMVAVVVEEALATSGPQLFSQGTADILLDSCVDYWNGEEVVSLSLSDRKKIQDFYQRTSLLAYCTAFAYRPLMHRIDKSLSKIYVELSPDCKKVYEYCQSPELLPSSQSTDNLFGKEKVLSDVVECFQEECNQVFIGMVDLVEELDHACIRFVHFSKENELRSRVFSEKMGLESGWNCHISLSSDQNQKKNVQSDGITEYPDCKDEFLLDEKIPLLNIYPSSLSQSRGLSMSAPNTSTDDLDEVKVEGLSPGGEPLSPNDSGEGAEEEENLGEYKETYVPPHSFGSNSCLTEVTDQGEEEDGVGFDMSNRARLPRGIENIRPHLKAVDNVPLQVSLFTECNSDLTRQMLEIMQEYEQIICVVGSCANNENFPIFSQADVRYVGNF